MIPTRVVKMGENGSLNSLLPKSPLLDDLFHEARQKYRHPKAIKSPSLTPMQLAIRKNIYARALSTPVRKCRVTGVMLPRFFLLDFCAIADPSTGVPWYMPRSLTLDKSVEEESNMWDGDPSTEHEVDSELTSTRKIDNRKKELNTKTQHDKNLPTSTPRIGGGTYILRSYQTLNSLQSKDKKGSIGKLTTVFLTQAVRNHPLALKTFQAAHFRPDMADFVLLLKRQRVVRALIVVTCKYKGYISMFVPTKSLKTCQVAAVLLLGPPLDNFKNDMVTEKEFRECIQRKPEDIPVFDLRILLGEKLLQELKNSDKSRWNSEVLTIKNRNYCQFLLGQLWELEGYLTPYPKDLL